MQTLITSTPAETEEAGRALAGRLAPGSVVALCGDLGAGKTHFARGLAGGWGADPAATASPTFTLLHEYEAPRGPVHHLDLYRARDAAEVWSAAQDELGSAEGLLVIEWADRFPELVPPGAHWVRIHHSGEGRREISMEP